MKRITAASALEGSHLPYELGPSYQGTWFRVGVDVHQVTACMPKEELVVGGAALYRLGPDGFERIPNQRVPGLTGAEPHTAVVPVGEVVLAIGPYHRPLEGVVPPSTDLQAIADWAVKHAPLPERSWFLKVFAPLPPPKTAALVLRIDDAPLTGPLEDWFGELAEEYSIGWMGCEAGCEATTFRAPLGESVLNGLKRLALGPEVQQGLQESSRAWLEDAEPDAWTELLVPNEPEKGWIDVGDFGRATDLAAHKVFLHPGVGMGRVFGMVEVAEPILEALFAAVDNPTLLEVASAPEEPVWASYLLGGRDKQTGELIGILASRVWT